MLMKGLKIVDCSTSMETSSSPHDCSGVVFREGIPPIGNSNKQQSKQYENENDGACVVSTKCPGDIAVKSDKVILIPKYLLVAKSHVHVSSLISNMEATARTHSCPAGKTGMFFLQYKGVQYKKSFSLNNQIILSCRKKQKSLFVFRFHLIFILSQVCGDLENNQQPPLMVRNEVLSLHFSSFKSSQTNV